MARLVDSTVLIQLERRGDHVKALSTVTGGGELAISVITASEILFGTHRANTEERRRRRLQYIEEVLAAVPVLPFDLIVARRHAALWAELSAAGMIIAAHDLIISATALEHGYSVLTENVRDFARVPGLVVERPNWP